MMETLLIAGACIVAIYVGFYMHLRLSLRFIAEQMANLDAQLAEALTSTIENLPLGDIPEVNPIQMMLMQLIQDNMAKIQLRSYLEHQTDSLHLKVVLKVNNDY